MDEKHDNPAETAPDAANAPKDASAADAKPTEARPPHQAFRGARQTRANPTMMTILNHERSKVRIFKLAVLIGVVVLAALALMVFLDGWRKRQATLEYLGGIEKRLKGIDAKIAGTTGYEKWKMARGAVYWADLAMRSDPSGDSKWDDLKRGYIGMIEKESRPVTDAGFVVPYTLVDMVYVPPGSFQMGARAAVRSEDYERPVRQVVLSKGFWMGRTEVTNAQFKVIYPDHVTLPWRDLMLNSYNQPAAYVDWHQAKEYCRILTYQESKSGRVPKDYEYRLPTEAEWEYACRAGTQYHYFWGDDFGATGAEYSNSLDLKSANFLGYNVNAEKAYMAPSDGYVVASPAGSFKANAFGLQDMIGNVWEWCYDWYNPNAYKDLASVDPVQSEPLVVEVEKAEKFDRRYTKDVPCKVIRGGSWGNLPSQLRCAKRDWDEPSEKNNGIGFRVVLAPCLK